MNFMDKLKQLQYEIYKKKSKAELIEELKSLQSKTSIMPTIPLTKEHQIKTGREHFLDTVKIYLLELEIQNQEQKEACQELQEELARLKEFQEKYPKDRMDELIRKNRELQTEISECMRIRDEVNKLWHAIEQSPSTVMITDVNGNIEYVNPKFTQLTGYTPEEVRGKNPRILKPDWIPSEAYSKLWETITSGGEWRGEMCNKKKNGDIYWEFASISAVRNPKGVITHFIGVKEDITERKQAEEERNRHIQELEDLMAFSTITNEAIQDDVLFKRLALTLKEHFNPDIIAVAMLDRERNMLYVPLIEPYMPVQELIKSEALLDPSLCVVLKNGQVQIVNDVLERFPCECICYKIEKGGYICFPLVAGGITFGMVVMVKKDMGSWNDDKIRRLMSSYIGLTALGLHRLELLDIAKHTNVTDELTGVYNHRFFTEILNKQLSLAKRRNENVSLLILDVDNFKRMNDEYGRDTSVHILPQIARILGDSLRDSGIVARYGEEAFAVIMPSMFKTRALVKADDLRRIIESAGFDGIVAGQTINVTVSIGVASFPEQAADQESLIKCANRALHHAEEEGGNRISSL